MKTQHFPFKSFLADYNNGTLFDKIVWCEGNASEEAWNVTVDQKENGGIDVTFKFTDKSVWQHFMYGGNSTRSVDVTNKYIPQLNIKVQKNWENDENYKESTRQDIDLVLQQKVGTSGWKDYQVFPIASDASILSKEYEVPSKVDGEDAQYKVIERVTVKVIERVTVNGQVQERVPGYANPLYSPESTATTDTTLTVTNKLLTTGLNFTKYANDGTTLLSGITFDVVATNEGNTYNESDTTNDDPKTLEDETGKVDFTGLPVGKYTLTETNIPTGYEQVGPWDFEVVDNDGVLSIEWGSNGSPLNDEGNLVNKLKPFDLTVNKTNDLGNPLSGAVFTLNGEEFPATVSEDGATFTFTGLTAPGTYTLHEETAPDGYRVLEKDIVIDIDALGNVTINTNNQENVHADGNDPDNVLVGGEGNNKITLTVANDPKAPLPSTGGPGTLIFSLIGMLALGATGLYFYFRKDQEVA